MNLWQLSDIIKFLLNWTFFRSERRLFTQIIHFDIIQSTAELYTKQLSGEYRPVERSFK